jgi:hypothetical protein
MTPLLQPQPMEKVIKDDVRSHLKKGLNEQPAGGRWNLFFPVFMVEEVLSKRL